MYINVLYWLANLQCTYLYLRHVIPLTFAPTHIQHPCINTYTLFSSHKLCTMYTNILIIIRTYMYREARLVSYIWLQDHSNLDLPPLYTIQQQYLYFFIRYALVLPIVCYTHIWLMYLKVWLCPLCYIQTYIRCYYTYARVCAHFCSLSMLYIHVYSYTYTIYIARAHY